MKKLFTLTFLFACAIVTAQNLISNGSFENYTGACPGGSPNGAAVSQVVNWHPGNYITALGFYPSVDLYCGEPNYGLCLPGPTPNVGSSGIAYLGMHTRIYSPFYNESIYQILSASLITGFPYTISFELMDCQSGMFTNGPSDFCVYLNSDTFIPACPSANAAVVNVACVPYDSISNSNWKHHSYHFVAPPNSNVIAFSGGTCNTTEVYYYLDNVVLTLDTQTCASFHVSLGNDTSVCSTDSVVLNATTAGAVYQWQDNSTSSTYTVTQGGTYIVTVSVSGCLSADTINVNTNSLPAVNIQANQSIFCASDSAQICSDSGFVFYLWNTGETSDCIYATHAGNYYLTVTDANNCTAVSNHLPIFIYPLPPVSVSVNGDTLHAFNAVSYQWYFNSNIIGGATDSTYIATQTGNYTVEITDTNGCNVTSNAVNVIVSGLKEIEEGLGVRIYPNPNSESIWQLQVANEWLNSKLEIFDAEGRLVFNSEIRILHSELSLDVSRGIYLLRILSNEKNVSMKLVKF